MRILQHCARLGKRSRYRIGQFPVHPIWRPTCSPTTVGRPIIMDTISSSVPAFFSTKRELQSTDTVPVDSVPSESTTKTTATSTTSTSETLESRYEQLTKLCHPDPHGFVAQHLNAVETPRKPLSRIEWRRKRFLEQYQKLLYPDDFDPPSNQWLDRMKKLFRNELENGIYLTYNDDDSKNNMEPRKDVNSEEEAFFRERISLLNAVNFSWHSVREERWYRFYRQLTRFVRQHGHAQVPYQKNAAYNSLCHWIWRQRDYQTRQQLAPHKLKLLEEIQWNKKAPPKKRGKLTWNKELFDKLISTNRWDLQLKNHAYQLRMAYHDGRLTGSQKALLHKHGIPLGDHPPLPHQKRWENQYQALMDWVEYEWLPTTQHFGQDGGNPLLAMESRRRHAFLRRPRYRTALEALRADNKPLYKWLLHQRWRYRAGTKHAQGELPEEYVFKLKALPKELFDTGI